MEYERTSQLKTSQASLPSQASLCLDPAMLPSYQRSAVQRVFNANELVAD